MNIWSQFVNGLDKEEGVIKMAKRGYRSKATKGVAYKSVVPGYKVSPGRASFEKLQLKRIDTRRKSNTRRKSV